MKEKSIRVCGLELKDMNNNTGEVAFYFSAWEKDLDNEIILKSAYTKTFDENKSNIYHNRDHTDVVGVPKSFGVDDKGAYCVSILALKTITGNDTYEQYKAGLIKGHSQEFQTLQDSFDKEQKARIIKQVKLWGVTSVTKIPANLDTPTMSIKSFSDAADYMNRINDLLTKGNISDGLGERFVAEFKTLKELLSQKSKALADAGMIHCESCMKVLDNYPDSGKCPTCGQFIFKQTQKRLFTPDMVKGFSLK